MRAGADTWVMDVAGSAKRRRAAPFAREIIFADRQLPCTGHFLEPPGEGDSWTHTDVWRAAFELPVAAVASDLDGRLL